MLKQTITHLQGKGLHLLIALLLFFQPFVGQANKPFTLDSLSKRQVWVSSQVLPGTGQIINRQYWKIPIFYAGMGSMIYLGNRANERYQSIRNEYNQPFYGPEEEDRFKEAWTSYRIERNFFYVGAAAFYLASVADALIVHSKDDHSPYTATILSALVPGMGQVYNQKIWKLPVVYGGLASLYYVYDFNQRGYKRFGDAYKQHPYDEFGGSRTKEELILLRDAYRRNRDLTIISIFAFYMLNIIDANVDAHFFDWDISDDLALNFEPIFNGGYTSQAPFAETSVGLKMRINF